MAKLFLIDILNTGKGRIDPDFKKSPDSNFSLPRFLENLVKVHNKSRKMTKGVFCFVL